MDRLFTLIVMMVMVGVVCYHVAVWDKLQKYYPDITLFEYLFMNERFVITPTYGGG